MQKLILFVCMLLHILLSAMEKQTYRPCICIDETFYHKTSLEGHLFAKLAERFSDIPYIGFHQKYDMLYHRSPLISTIHSPKYLRALKKNRSRIDLVLMLKQTSVTVTATKYLLEQLDKQEFPHYAISLGEGYSFAGYNQSHHGHTYAAIPAAALYALNTQLVKNILVIDENINENGQFYYEQGNGSIFFSEENPKLADLFDNKITTFKEMREIPQLLDLDYDNINLAFYNINIEHANKTVEKRLLSIANILNKRIPTVFILSGDKNKHSQTVCSIIDYIDNIVQLLFTRYSTPQLPATSSTSHASSLDSSEDKDSTSDDNSSSTSSSEMGERFSFKIITDPEQASPNNDFNYVYLAKNITIDNNGAMEVVLDENYPGYGGRYHSTTSSSSKDIVSASSEES